MSTGVSIVGGVGLALVAFLWLSAQNWRKRMGTPLSVRSQVAFLILSAGVITLMTIWAWRTDSFPATFGPSTLTCLLLAHRMRAQQRTPSPPTR